MRKMKTMDGNTAAAHVSYAFTEVTAIYPITPSSPMAEHVDEWVAQGRKNIFGQPVKVMEMQSEGGAAGAVHGSLQAGAYTTTYTASQGLLLMIPNMYKIAGERLPGVIHVSARALATSSLNIFGDHQDVMATRQTGCAMLASSSVQEVMDLAPVAHLSAIKGRLPFVNFFDGFRTSHEIQKVEALEYDDLASLIDEKALKEFKARALSPNNPVTRGTAQNPDIYFQTKEASEKYYEHMIDIVSEYMEKIEKLTGRHYGLFDYYGPDDAEMIIVAMGSVTETITETIDYLNNQGEKYGVVKVHLYRPFSIKHFLDVVPKTVKRIAVLDRTKEPGAIGEPLYLDVRSCYYNIPNAPIIIGGRFGLGSKDTTPNQIKAVFDNLKSDNPKNRFTIGIIDDVCNTSLMIKEHINTEDKGTVRCKIWGLGSDGTVGANKQAIKIIGDYTEKKVQGYFSYDSKKSGGLTVSHLRFGDNTIKSAYLIEEADYIACHNQSYVNSYDIIKGIKKGGTFVLNCRWSEDELDKNLPAQLKRDIAEKDIKFYCIDAIKIAEEIGLGNRISMIMQGTFFKLTNIIPEEKAKVYLKEAIKKLFSKKGEKIVQMNWEAIDKGYELIKQVKVKEQWKTARDVEKKSVKEPEFISKIMRPMLREEGTYLPVSAFNGMEDGTFPPGTVAYEKRGIAINVPEWNIETCIQCNQCSYICPHSCIRPFLLTEEEIKNAPEEFKTKKAIGKGLQNFGFRIQVTTMDCTGCGNCADICPARPKALVMKKFSTQVKTQVPNWDYAVNNVSYKGDLIEGTNVKGSQYKRPYLEFSGACAGCGETPYIKLVTQLFGNRMMIANATGCSSIWAASAPATAYTCNEEGKGPSWANSLFEDNAEYGLGMHLAVKQIRDKIEEDMKEVIKLGIDNKLKDVFEKWIEVKDCGEESEKASEAVENILKDYKCKNREEERIIQQIKDNKNYLIKTSQWIIGGDGWAYDIGYGGLDHVVASGEDVNILVFDTEIYSNTGGQASKATPTAAIAKFESGGKKSNKKDLGRMMMTYGNVYVAQIAMGADKNQTIKAILEAEKFKGPSIIIAYAPCINHGIKEGMGRSIVNMDKAVKCGYWHLYRYNPELKEQGKNPFILDSKEPKESFREFIMGQVRYSALQKQYPHEAEELFVKCEELAKERYKIYKNLSELN